MTDPSCSRCGHEPLHGRCTGCGHWLCTLCAVLNRGTVKLRTCDEPYACTPCRTRLKDIVTQIGDDWPHLPLALHGTGGQHERVTGGATHPSLPFTVDAWDLLTTPERARYAQTAPEYVDDQIGWLPVEVVLAGWIDDWCSVRDAGENGPDAHVLGQVQWLAERTDWACTNHPAVDDYAREIAALGGIVHALGPGSAEQCEACEGKGCDDCHHRGVVPISRPINLPGQPCPRCRYSALVRKHNGDVECQHPTCGTIWREAEYEHVTKAAAAALRRNRPKEAA